MVSFRIRRPYFDAIVKGYKTIEFRSATPFWIKRVANAKIAVFVCGKDVHRRYITKVEHLSAIEAAEELLGRSLSSQGRQDIYTDAVLAIHLGEVYVKEAS